MAVSFLRSSALAFAYFLLRGRVMALLALGQRSRAVPLFDAMLLLRPLDRYALASRGHVLAQLGRPLDSLASLQQLSNLAGSPQQQASAWFNLGYVLQQAGQHEDARHSFEKALANNERMDSAWYGLALVLMQQRKFHEAVLALQKNTALQPMSPYGWYRLTQAWVELGEMEKARQTLKHLNRFEPGVAAQLARETGMDLLMAAHCVPVAPPGYQAG